MARLLTVHAHPDDEASKGAPTMAKLVAEGHETFLVCATGGEEGDILNKDLDRPEIRENLTAVRAAELEASVAAIGFSELVWLGYRDSGMADTEPNKHPEAFANADIDEATGRLVAIIRRLRPHVLMTYSDDQQGYLHPDHLRVYDISALAYDRAGDAGWYPELGEPWQPSKLYYSMWSRARMLAYHDKFAELGLESPYDNRWFDRPSLDHRITTKIDITGYQHVRTAALLAHATQVDPKEKFWFGLPEDASVAAYPYEDFILAHSHVDTDLPESDLFAGLSVEVDQ
ncbi:MAG: mycothiol conjugate amidase Mca [Acidimicrobiales bacterium]